MSEPFKELADLDKLIHEPARLAITTALSACEPADFLSLQRLTGLSKGNLSAHLSKLAAGGVVTIAKRFVGKRPETSVRLTSGGADALAAHWDRLDALRLRAREWAEQRGAAMGGRPGVDPAGAPVAEAAAGHRAHPPRDGWPSAGHTVTQTTRPVANQFPA